MRVVFWGTPDFALPTLEAIRESPHDLVGVVTRPDRPAGRGRRLREPPVKRAVREAEAAGHPEVAILQPAKPRGEEFLARLAELEPEVSVVAAYGEILTEPVLELPERGSVNVHASLLPELRGAAPVNWAIIRGHRRSGVTIMRMVRELDAGPVLKQVEVEVPPRATAGELFRELSELGARALVETLDEMEAGEARETPQDHDRATYAPKLDRKTARLDWSLPAGELDRWIRGCDPWPAAWSRLRHDPGQAEPAAEGEEAAAGGGETLDVQLFAPRPDPDPGGGGDAEPGTVLTADDREGLVVATVDGRLRVGEVKPAGSRRMEAAEWIRGRGVSRGDRFT